MPTLYTHPYFHTPRFKLRVRFFGTLTVVCPFCGCVFDAMLYPMSSDGTPIWRVKCPPSGSGSSKVRWERSERKGNSSRGCGRVFIPRVHLSLAPPGRQAVPDDYIIPKGLQEAFPLGDLYEWRSRWPAHQLYIDQTRELVERVGEVAGEMERESGGALGYYTVLGKAFEKVREEWQASQTADNQSADTQ